MSVPFYLSSMGSTDGERGGVGEGLKQLIMYATHHFSYTIGLGVNDDIYIYVVLIDNLFCGWNL
jgi:hypothetical protein